ncbi:MAG: glycosyltransferase family 39 protein [Lachnospiraceae bacterium]|nr:glycosyltransferase family 39 protein [Lachnospiraceae bacterium]
MKKFQQIRLPEWITAGIALIYYWVMALYKLTEAPIWQDESMEFYCSIPVKGAIRGVTKYATMYERMANIQQQPPLYNWVMSLWLRFGEGEWWYRFSSAVFGFIAAIGLYFVIRKLCDRYMAAFCVVIYSSIYTLMYYVKEASEYALLLAFLFWLVYVWFLLCEQMNRKRILWFTLLCVLSVFTHYGAVFVAVPFGISVLVMAARRGDWGCFLFSLVSDIAAGGIGGFCLVYFFLIPQSANQVSTLYSEQEIIIEKGNILYDFFYSLMWVFKWSTIDMDRDWEKIWWLIIAAMVVIALIIVFVAVKSRRDVLRKFLYCNIAVYLIYYVITKLNIYAYGWYGNRYNMFLFPLWFVLIAVSLYEFVLILRQSSIRFVAGGGAKIVQIGLVSAGVLYCVYGDYRISCHWNKMDLRTVVAEWYALDGYEVPTLLDFHQRYGFTYYFTHNANYDESQWENIVYNDEVEDYSANSTQVWKDYLNKVYDSQIPDELYLVTGQWNAFVDTFVELGYEVEPMVDTTAELYHLTKQ